MHEPGPPTVLKLETRPVPSPEPGQVLIKVKAFGLNRSEMFTRQVCARASQSYASPAEGCTCCLLQGHSPGVTFPRVLGIEACGVVEAAPGGEFEQVRLQSGTWLQHAWCLLSQSRACMLQTPCSGGTGWSTRQ